MKDFEYDFLTNKKRKKADEEDVRIRDSHGFDEKSFFGIEYHGRARKRNKKKPEKMNKKQIQKLATADNVTIKYSGKDKIAYLKCIFGLSVHLISKYTDLIQGIGYRIKNEKSV